MDDENYAYVLVADPKYWKRLWETTQNGKNTHAFVRKNQVGPTNAKKLLFYLNKPVRSVWGVADFLDRSVADCKSIWASYGEQTCFETFDEYQAFMAGRPVATFVRFTNLQKIANPKSPKTVNELLGSPKRFMGRYVTQEVAEQLTT
ncbi:MAG: hypothetical protein NWF04_00650 [Candidatus Bathyarchaeota archaeon]|nr:hypothetical protein [Candidatus Bathyarchaeota archaeon]